MTEYTDRAFIVVPLDAIETANTLAAAADPDSGGHLTFSRGTDLSADGEAPATHRGVSSMVTQNGKSAIVAAAAQLPVAAYFFASAGWTFDSAIADLGLVRVEPVQE